MLTISLISQKGGTAKTTTAVNLAVEATRAGYQAVIIDLDPQCSASEWKDLRGDRLPEVAAAPVPHLSRVIKAAEGAGCQLAIIDTAGRNNDAALEAASAADLVIIPMQGTFFDLKTLEATLKVLRLSGGKRAVALITRVRTTSRKSDAERYLESKGIEVLTGALHERVEYQDSTARGLGVSESDETGKAAREFRKIWREISILLALEPRSA